jgi:WD40 repeat protein
MGALCLTVVLGVARADVIIGDYEIYPDPRDQHKANTDAIRDLAASPDGKTLVCAGRGGFFIYNAETGKRLAGLPDKVDYATGVAFSPDGKALYTADTVGNLLRWDLDKRTVAFRFPQVHAAIERIALSADGSTLASTDGTHTVFWDARTGKFVHAWSPPPNYSRRYMYHRYFEERIPERAPRTIRHHLVLSPDGRWCAAGHTAQAFHLRAASADAAKHVWPDDTVASIDIAPDGKSYAVSARGGDIEIVASQSLRPILGCKSPCSDCFVRHAPDGKTLIGHQPDLGVLAALDVATGKLRWQHQQAPAWRSTALAFAGPTQLATGDSDRRLRIYDLATGNLLRTIELPAEPKQKEKDGKIALPRWLMNDITYILVDEPALTPIDAAKARQRLGTPHLWHPAPLSAGVFLNDGKELLVMPQGTAPIVFDTQTGKPIRRLDELQKKITEANNPEHCAVSADLRRMFISSGYNLYVWDLVKHRIEHEYEFPTRLVALALARDGKRFAVAGYAEIHCPQPIFVGSTDSPEIQTIQGHEFTIAHLAFSADGKRLFSASPAALVQIPQVAERIPGLITEWDLPTGKAARSHRQEMSQFASSPDANLWALQEGNQVVCQLFDWRQQKVVGKIESRAETFAFTPDGTALATGGADQVVQLWDARTGKLLRKFRGHHEQGTALLCFSADGRLLATKEMTDNGSGAGSLRMWDVKTGAEVCVNPGHRGPINRVAYSPDGRLIVSAGGDRRILWWDAKTGRMIGESKAEVLPYTTTDARTGHIRSIRHLCFSADGSRLATACAQNILVWDVATRKLVGQIPSCDSNMKCMALSPDGKQVVTLHPNGAVDTWDVATGKNRAHFKLWPLDPDGEQAPVVRAAFSPDATHLAVFPPNATEILVYHVGSGKMVRCLAIAPPRVPEVSGSQPLCLAVVFSADGRYLTASVQDSSPRFHRSGWDATPPRSSIHVWELAGGAKTTMIRDIPGAVYALAFSPDGRSLLHGISSSSSPWSEADAAAVVRDLSAGTELKLFRGAGPACVCMATGWELPILPGAFQTAGCFAFSPDGQAALTCDRDRTLLTWDARVFAPAKTPGVKLGAAEQDAAWADLALTDGKKVHRAIGQLTRDPRGTLAFLKDRLALPAEPPAQREQELIRALGSEAFSARAAAMRELEHYRELVEPALRTALADERDPQRRRGLEALLARIGDDLHPDCLRERRAVEVLEKLDSADARAWLAELAAGPAHARLTREAGAVMARLRLRDAASAN